MSIVLAIFVLFVFICCLVVISILLITVLDEFLETDIRGFLQNIFKGNK